MKPECKNIYNKANVENGHINILKTSNIKYAFFYSRRDVGYNNNSWL